MKYIHLLLLMITSFVISFVLHNIGLILPWLFGSMIATYLYIRFVTRDFYFPKLLGDIGIFVIGFEIGTHFTLGTMQDMVSDAFNIVTLSLAVILLSLILSRMFMKLTGCTSETALLSTIPGALSQMLIMAEEDKRADMLLVTMTQMSRIVLVVILVPFIANLFHSGGGSGNEETAPLLTDAFMPAMTLIFIGAVVLIKVLGMIKFPVPFMLGPIIAVVIWNMTAAHEFSMNVEFMYAAQVLLGIRIGIQLSSLLYQLNSRMVLSMLFQNILLILGTMLIVGLFNLFTEHGFNNLFLSAAPGGIGQLIIVAVEMGADIAMISSYHIFRIFFIILIVVPLINYYLKWKRREV